MSSRATLEAAIAKLAEHRIGAVVVLGADRRVIGILSERDIVRAFAEFGADALNGRPSKSRPPMSHRKTDLGIPSP